MIYNFLAIFQNGHYSADREFFMSPIFKKSANLAACAHNLCAAKFSLSKNHRDLIINCFLLCKYLPFTLKNNRPVFSLSKITPPYTARQHCARSRLSKPRPLSTQSVMGYPVPMSYTNHACIYDIWRVNVAPPMNTHNLPVCVLAMATNSISRSIVCPVLKILPET